MAERRICPVCGESNPADMEFCRNCQSRLQPLTGPLKNESGAIQPGEIPTKKVTSELEPLLPQWLRDARQQARETTAEDQSRSEQEQKEAATPSVPDLLDGLATQGEEEDEDVPDWLAQITGATSKKKKPASEDKQAKRVELGRERQAPQGGDAGITPPEAPSTGARHAEKDELSDWFKQAAASSETADFRMPPAPYAEPAQPYSSDEAVTPPAPQRPAEDLSWLRNLEAQPETPAESAPAREEAPDWLKKLQAEQTPPPAPTPAPSPVPQAEMPDWLRQFDDTAATTPPVPPATPVEPLADFGAPDWLKGLPAAPSEAQPPESPQTSSSQPLTPTELPDWMSALRSQQGAPAEEELQSPSSEPLASVGLPDWISALGAEREATPEPPPASEPIAPAELPDWISSLGTGQAAPPATEPEPPASEALPPTELPDWISSLGTQQATPQATESELPAGEAMPPAELPDWISSLGAEQAAPQQAEPEPPAGEAIPPAVLPDWLASLGTEQPAPPSIEEQPAASEPGSPAELPDWMSSLGGEPTAPLAAEPSPAPEETIFSGELPDWLSSLGSPEPAAEEAKPAAGAPEPAVAPPAQESAAPGPALTPEAVAGEDVDAVFASMQTPDWLSAVLPSSEEPADSEPAPAAAAEEPIGPAELPSWVQAMRPVESVMGSAAGAADMAAEERGPLVGLHGVLPSIPGAGEPSSKPRPQSFKLSASEQQLAHAALLERILAAETAPIPMRTGAVLRPQKMLRWAISAVMLLVLGAIVFAGTSFLALPAGVPNETSRAINAVEAIPADAPVLVVFDYQPSTVGEMEAAAGPLLDHMLVLNPPRFALLSTSPTGPALAERFMTQVLSTRAHLVPDQQYVNLGYLPGGLAGVYSFAQNPTAALPLDAHLRSAWQASFLAPVHNLSDFAAIIVLTDSIESGRTWIEQTALERGQSPLVVVASAQASPMLLPYADSGQIAGMVSGLYGAVGVDQKNAGSPACVGRYEGLLAGQANRQGPSCVRRYWSAYSAGLYLAVIMVMLGALWNLWQGIRERRAQAVG